MANLKTAEKKTKAQSMGMHTETLTGKTQQKFFNPDEAENFFYWAPIKKVFCFIWVKKFLLSFPC